MLSDPISDMLTRIKNAYMAGKQDLLVPASKIKLSIAKLLKESGYLKSVEEIGDKKKELKITLSYKDNKPAMENIKRVSKPGRRIYKSSKEIPNVLSGYGTVILSTSKGIMTSKQARKENVGGEIICEVY